MEDSLEPRSLRKNFFAIIISLVFVYPGMIIGNIIAKINWYFTERYLGDGIFFLPDTWNSNILLFFELYFSYILQGLAAGYFSLFIASKIIKSADYRIVFFAVVSMISLIYFLLLMSNIFIFKIYENNLKDLMFHISEAVLLVVPFSVSSYAFAKEYFEELRKID